MNTLALVWLGVLTLLSLGMLLLPFVPACFATRQAGSKNADNKAHKDDDWLTPVELMRQQIEHEFAALLSATRNSGSSRGSRRNGTHFIVLGPDDHLAAHLSPSSRKLDSWVIAARHLDLPGEMQCSRPLYAQARATIAHDASIRTVLSAHDVVLGTYARVRRWAHADRRLDAAEGAALYGCASAGGEITLARRVRFERLLAPRIVFGKLAAPSPPVAPTRQPATLPSHAHVLDQRCLIQGDWHLAAATEIQADVVVEGDVRLASNSCLRGSLRASGAVWLETGASVLGAIVAEGGVHLAAHCSIKGPLVCLGALSLGSGSVIGSAQQATSISAHQIRVEAGCITHGAVWARRGGEVLAGSRE